MVYAYSVVHYNFVSNLFYHIVFMLPVGSVLRMENNKNTPNTVLTIMFSKEHLRLKSPKHLRTFSLSPKLRRSLTYRKRVVIRFCVAYKKRAIIASYESGLTDCPELLSVLIPRNNFSYSSLEPSEFLASSTLSRKALIRSANGISFKLKLRRRDESRGVSKSLDFPVVSPKFR